MERRNDKPYDTHEAIQQVYGVARIEHRKSHSLWHTSATLLLYADVNIKQVRGSMGMEILKQPLNNLHLIEAADIKAVNKLGIMLFSQKLKKATEIS